MLARLRLWPWPALGIFFGTAVVAGVLILIGDLGSGPLVFELAKSGVQLLVVAVLGGAVAWAFRWLDDKRDERRRLDESRLGAIGDLQNAYYEAKRVRRALRAAGFDKPGLLRAASSGEQSDTFND